MTEPEADDILLDELRAIARDRTEPVPPLVLAASRSAYTWRTVDAELALLAYDSAADERALTGVRGSEARLVSFAAERTTIDVEVREDANGTRSVEGEAAPSPRRLELLTAGGAPSLELEVTDGHFTATGLARGPVRFRLEMDGGRSTITDWLSI